MCLMRPDSLSIPFCVVSRAFVRIGTKKFVLINQTQSNFYLEHQSTINSVGIFPRILVLPARKLPPNQTRRNLETTAYLWFSLRHKVARGGWGGRIRPSSLRSVILVIRSLCIPVVTLLQVVTKSHFVGTVV